MAAHCIGSRQLTENGTMTENSRPTTAVSLPRLTEAPVKRGHSGNHQEEGPEPVKVLIEYCQRCYRHPWCVNHSEERYFSQFMDIAGRISRAFPGMVDEIIAVKDPRIGALEVTVVHGEHQQVVFSKLESDRWPNVPKILERIRRVSQRMVNPGPKSSLLIENEFLTPRHHIVEVSLPAEAPVPFALGLEITDRPPFLVTVVQEGKYGAECRVARGDVLHCINGQACDRMDLEGLLTELRKRPMNLYCRRFDRTKKRRPVGNALSFARLFGRRPISMRAEKAATAHMQRQRKGMTTIDTIPPRPPPSRKLPKPTYQQPKRVERHDEKGPTIGPPVKPPRSAPQQGHRPPRPQPSEAQQRHQKPSEQSRSEMLLQNPGRIRPPGRNSGEDKKGTKPVRVVDEVKAEPTKKEETVVEKEAGDAVETPVCGEEVKGEEINNAKELATPEEPNEDLKGEESPDAPEADRSCGGEESGDPQAVVASPDDDEYEEEFESEDEKWDESPPDVRVMQETAEGDNSHNPGNSAEAPVSDDKQNEIPPVEEGGASSEVADNVPASPELSDAAPIEIASVDGDAEEQPAPLVSPVDVEGSPAVDESQTFGDEGAQADGKTEPAAPEGENLATGCPAEVAAHDATPSPRNEEEQVAESDEVHDAVVSNVVDNIVRRASSRVSSPEDAALGLEGSTVVEVEEDDTAKAVEAPQTTMPEETVEAAPTAEEPVEAAPTAEEPVEAALRAEEPVEAALTAEEPVEAALTAEEQVETALTTEEPVEAALTTEEPVEAALTAEEPVEAALTTEEPVEAALTAEEPVEAALTTEEPVEAALTTEEPVEAALTTEEPVEAALTTEETIGVTSPKVEASEAKEKEESKDEYDDDFEDDFPSDDDVPEEPKVNTMHRGDDVWGGNTPRDHRPTPSKGEPKSIDVTNATDVAEAVNSGDQKNEVLAGEAQGKESAAEDEYEDDFEAAE